MASSFGHLFRVTTFGESHGEAVGAIVDGCPPGLEIDANAIQSELARRRPGQSPLVSPRVEPDELEILSGLFNGRTLGSPICLQVRNLDCKPADYETIEDAYRPGHADYSTEAKLGLRDPRGGGRASARETIGRVAAGGIARQLLTRDVGVEVIAWVESIGKVGSSRPDQGSISREMIDASALRCPDEEACSRMEEALVEAREHGDSLGGVVACVAKAVPAGWGEPVFDKLTSDLAKALMSIPAARGFEVGEGFAAAAMNGSEHNDSMLFRDGKVRTARNIAGGLSGGIATGEEIRIRVAFKPPSSIARTQETITRTGAEKHLLISGRHDPCVAPRAVPVVEAMVLLVLADHYLRHRALTGWPGPMAGPAAP